MKIIETDLPEAMVVVPARHGDARGYFTEVYQRERFAAQGIAVDFIQDNQAHNRDAGVVRGLHFQSPPHAQAKLVSVLQGRIYDVAVDVRKDSPTYGQHVGAELDAAEGWQIYVPAGFLHGFVTREPDTIVQYKVSDVYAPDCDGGVLWNDPDLGIDWGISAEQAQLSAKDAVAQRFADFKSPF